MGDRHGGRFARRGRALNPPHPQVDAHRGVGFRWRATVFRCRGVVGRICPHARRLSSAKASRHGARAKEFVPTREHAPRRRPPDTAHERKDLCRAGTRPSAKASRHGARAKGFAPTRERSPRRKSPDTAHERKDLPTRERSPRRRPPDTAHERKNLPRGVRPRPTCRRTAGRPRPTDSRKTPLRRGRTHSARPLPSSFTKKNKTTP